MSRTLEELQDEVAVVAQRPDRMYLQDLVTLEVLTAQMNPETFEEQLKVEWARLSSPGFSSKHLQYLGTENVEYQFDLVFDANIEGMNIDDILFARSFLMSLCYAKKGATNPREGQAPRVLFVWPKLISLTAVISDIRFRYDRFHVTGAPTRYTATVKLEEIRDVRLYGEDVRDQGTRRVAGTI